MIKFMVPIYLMNWRVNDGGVMNISGMIKVIENGTIQFTLTCKYS